MAPNATACAASSIALTLPASLSAGAPGLDALVGLTSRRVTAARPDYRQIIDLYERSFPEHERVAPWMLRFAARRDSCDFLAFYDAGDLCALAYTVTTGRLTYLLYLAVDDRMRGRGYGTRVLTWLKARRPRRPIALGIEPLYPDAPNYEQRVRRLAFYERNGFCDTGYVYTENGDTYTVLYDGVQFDPRALEEAVDELSFGLTRASVTLVNNEARIRGCQTAYAHGEGSYQRISA